VSVLRNVTLGKLKEFDTRHPLGLASAVLAVGLIVRLAIVALTRHGFVPVSDDADYSRLAESIATGHGFGSTAVPLAHGPTAFRPPLYPGVLSITYLITGVSWTSGRVENAVIGTLAVAAIGFLAKELWDRRVALVAMAIAAIYPPLLLASYGLGYEALLITLLTTSLACAVRARGAERPVRWIVLAGICAGFAILTRETAVAVLPVLLFVAWKTARGSNRRTMQIAQIALALCATLVVVAPWTIRNAVRFHAFVPVSTSLGYAIEGTYNVTATEVKGGPDLWIPPGIDPASSKLLRTMKDETEVRADDGLIHLTEHYIAAHPTYVAHVALWNTVRLFDLRGPSDSLAIAPYVPYNRTLVYLSVYSSYLVDLLVVVGCFTRRARRVPWYFWTTPVILFLGIIVVSGNIRYRAVLEPFIVLLASLAVVAGYERWLAPDAVPEPTTAP